MAWPSRQPLISRNWFGRRGVTALLFRGRLRCHCVVVPRPKDSVVTPGKGCGTCNAPLTRGGFRILVSPAPQRSLPHPHREASIYAGRFVREVSTYVGPFVHFCCSLSRPRFVGEKFSFFGVTQCISFFVEESGHFFRASVPSTSPTYTDHYSSPASDLPRTAVAHTSQILSRDLRRDFVTFPLRRGNSRATTCQARTNNDCVPAHCCQPLSLCRTWFPAPLPISKNIGLGLATQRGGPYQQVTTSIKFPQIDSQRLSIRNGHAGSINLIGLSVQGGNKDKLEASPIAKKILFT